MQLYANLHITFPWCKPILSSQLFLIICHRLHNHASLKWSSLWIWYCTYKNQCRFNRFCMACIFEGRFYDFAACICKSKIWFHHVYWTHGMSYKSISATPDSRSLILALSTWGSFRFLRAQSCYLNNAYINILWLCMPVLSRMVSLWCKTRNTVDANEHFGSILFVFEILVYLHFWASDSYWHWISMHLISDCFWIISVREGGWVLVTCCASLVGSEGIGYAITRLVW